MVSIKIIYNNKYILQAVTVSLIVGFLIHFPELVSLTDSFEQQTLFPDMTSADVFFEVGYTFLSLLLLFTINTLLFGFNNPTVRINTWKVIGSFILTWVLSKWLGEFFVYLHQGYHIPAIDAMVHHYLHPVRDFIISLIVTGTCYISHLTRQRQTVLVQNEKLVAESIQNQYQALKNQLNPHMLFNSLNTLQSLVRENPDRAQDYICELSRVLRYTLQDNGTYSVSLREEMEFTEAYIFLLRMRYEDNLRFIIEANESLKEYRLPPLSIQLLVENAVKHNEISNRNPLTIHILTNGYNSLCVENSIQPRRSSVPGTGIGLANLSKRYRLIFQKEIHITENEGKFKVCIPLVKP